MKIFHNNLTPVKFSYKKLSSRMTANNKISEMVEMETKPASISGTSKIDDEKETKASEVQMELEGLQ